MMHAQNIKFGILSGLQLICTIMLSVPADNQMSVFAQITPAPEKFGSSDDSSTDSSLDAGPEHGNSQSTTSSDEQQDKKEPTEISDSDSNDNSQAITPSEVTDEATEDSTDSTDSSDVSGGQTTTEQDDQPIMTEEQDSDPTNQLVEAITNEVNEVLSAAGIIGP